jgi:hypothetical protein
MTRRAALTGLLVGLMMVAWEVLYPIGSAPSTDSQLPELLSQTGLYVAGKTGVVAAQNRPYSPQYPLWSDGASKRRWVFLPPGTTIDVSRIDRWDFPVGTRFWKEFSFDGRKVETRLLWKASPGGWVAAAYVWNAAGTDAMLASADGIATDVEVAPGRTHSIPSRGDCAACHGSDRAPAGFNALQLSTDRDPNAIHGEPLLPEMITMQTLVGEKLVSPAESSLVRDPPRIPTSDPQTRAVLGYLSTNCGICHKGSTEIAAQVPSLRYSDVMRDGDAVARTLVGRPTSWQAPGRPDGSTLLIDAHSPESSAILLRMKSRRPSSQMPPLGTAVRDNEALEAIRKWVETFAASLHR